MEGADRPALLRDAVARGGADATAIMVDFRNVALGDAGLVDLVRSLKNNRRMVALNLRWNYITDAGAPLLAEVIRDHPTLVALNLDFNHLGDGGVKVLADAIKETKTPRVLLLDCNGIGDEGAEALAEMVVESGTVEELSLYANNRIGFRGASALMGTIRRSWTPVKLGFYFGWGLERRAKWEEERRTARKTLLTFVAYDADAGAHDETPRGRFLKRDGDNAVSARVLEFLE